MHQVVVGARHQHHARLQRVACIDGAAPACPPARPASAQTGRRNWRRCAAPPRWRCRAPGVQPASTRATATGPPVEAPIASSCFTPACTPTPRFVAAPRAGGLRPRSCAAACRWCVILASSCVACAAVAVAACPAPGVAVTSSAPAPIARNTWPTLSCGLGGDDQDGAGRRRMIWRVASTPSSSGIIRSISTRSGRVSCAQAHRLAPAARHPQHLVLAAARHHPAQRFGRHGDVVGDADLHRGGPPLAPIRSTTASSRVSS